MTLEYVFVVALGIVIGSFLNVCIYRIPRNESIISPGSHCPSCNKKIGFLELIPVISYLFLRGKCSKCNAKISFKYPAIEILTGMVFLVIFIKYDITYDFFAYAFFMSILIAVFFIDIEHLIIPNKLVLIALLGAFITFIYNIFQPMNIYGDNNWYNPLLGVLIGCGSLLLISILGMLFYKDTEVMGMGDVKIFAPIGMFLGFKLTVLVLILSMTFGAIISIVLIIVGIKDRKSTIAFGPFIVMATFITLIYGWNIFNWWMGLYC